MKHKLLKDIVIPKGTIFTIAPQQVQYKGANHIECIIGLSKNTHGNLHYDISDDKIKMKEYFKPIED